MSSTAIYLERHEDEVNLHRFYVMEIAQDLFGVWLLIRRWGRVGAGQGQSQVRMFETKSAAQKEAVSASKSKVRRGYQLIG